MLVGVGVPADPIGAELTYLGCASFWIKGLEGKVTADGHCFGYESPV